MVERLRRGNARDTIWVEKARTASALRIRDERYARGEIGQEEYQQRCRDVEGQQVLEVWLAVQGLSEQRLLKTAEL